MEELGMGYHFTPTDVEMLILLRQKAEGKSMCSQIIERDIYGEKGTPWMIFKEDDPWEIIVDVDSTKSTKDIKALYVITKLMKISELKTIRVAGCGTWEGQTGKSYIKIKDKKIGFKKMFNFRAKKTSDTYGNWIMHEYHLDGDFLKGVSNDYVICRIKRVNSRTTLEKLRTTYSGTGIEASKVQEHQEFLNFPGCTASFQELAKRKYSSTFEEETWRESKLFKRERVEYDLKESSNTTIDAAKYTSSCDFAVQSIAGEKKLPELVHFNGEGSTTNNEDTFNDVEMDGQYDELEEFIDFSRWEIDDLAEYIDKEQLSVDCQGVQSGNPDPNSTSVVAEPENSPSRAECQEIKQNSFDYNSTYTSTVDQSLHEGFVIGDLWW